MPDREKVMKGLETCSDVYYGADGACSSCPYSQINGDRCVAELVHDAIKLLKEQESEWVEQVLCYDTDVIWMCGKCKAEYTLIDGTPFENEYFFCPHCGAKMAKEVRVEEEEDE